MFKRLVLCSLALLPLASPSLSQESPDRVFLQLGQQPGGMTDNIARVVGAHIGKNLPGAPEVTVQNVPGAAGLNALRRLDESGKIDGSVIVMSSISHLVSNRIDPTRGIAPDFRWIGALSTEPAVCMVNAELGINSLEDMQGQNLRLGSSTPSASNYIDAAIVKNALDIDLKIITGFRGGSEANLAIERGEIDGACGLPLYSFLKSPFSKGKTILGYWGLDPVEEFSEISGHSMIDLIEDPLDREAVEFLETAKSVRYVMWVHKDTPDALVNELSDSFQVMFADPEFQSDIARLLPVFDPRSGPEVEAFISEMSSANDAVVERARELSK